MKFKDYQSDYSKITVRPNTVAFELLTCYNLPTSNYTEGLLKILSHSSLQDLQADTVGFIMAFDFLNKKLEAARKTISFWDAYQIQETIDDREQMLGQLSHMPVNTSIVSNLRDPFQWLNDINEQETVYRGDLFIKDYNGRVHLVHGISQGSYRPTTMSTSGSNAQIQYVYTQNAQPGDEEEISVVLPSAPLGYNESIDVTANNLQGESFNQIAHTGQDPIAPVVKYYITTLDGNSAIWKEQVIFDGSYKQSSNSYTVFNPTCFDLIAEVK